MKQTLSVTIITKNNEKTLRKTLEALKFADEVIVIDSGSSDQTLQICSEFGITPIQQAFEGYGKQKNIAASYAKGPWILNVDSDEVLDSELQQSIEVILNNDLERSATCYPVGRINYYLDQPIKNGGWYPDNNVRLYQKSSAKWTEPAVHEKLLPIIGNTGKTLEGHLHHFTFLTFEQQIQTNMRYAKQGAQDLLEKSGRPSLIKFLMKPIGKFIECYFLKGGFLDGRYGFIISVNAAHSIFMKYAYAYNSDRVTLDSH